MRAMKTAILTLTALFAASSIAFTQGTTPSSATSPAPANARTSAATTATSSATSTQPSEAEMKQMMELAKTGENHKLLASMAGTWSYNVTMWMAPGAPPSKSTGTAVRKAIMGGRDRKSTRLNSSHDQISYAVFCLKKKKNTSCQ